MWETIRRLKNSTVCKASQNAFNLGWWAPVYFNFHLWCAACYQDVRRLCVRLVPSYRRDKEEYYVVHYGDVATSRSTASHCPVKEATSSYHHIITGVSEVSLILNVGLNSCAVPLLLVFVAHPPSLKRVGYTEYILLLYCSVHVLYMFTSLSWLW